MPVSHLTFDNPLVGGPLGYCMYGPDHRRDQLSREHVVPEGLGSGIIMRDASCEECRLKTHAIETECLGKNWKLYRDINRERIRGKKAEKNLTDIFVVENGIRKKRTVLLDESPSFVVMPLLQGGLGMTTYYAGPIFSKNVVFADDRRSAFARAVHAPTGAIQVDIQYNVGRVFQQIAKIAHGLMYYYWRVDGVRPLLLDLIFQDKMLDITQFIGMAPKALHARDLVKGMNALHLFDAVFTYTTQGTFILGYDICLFANLGCPTYRLYVGAYKKQPEPITWGHRQH